MLHLEPNELVSIYALKQNFDTVEQILPSLDESTIQAIWVLRYCRYKLIQAELQDVSIQTYDIAQVLARAQIPDAICQVADSAIAQHAHDVECFTITFLEELELRFIGLDLMAQMARDS